MKKFYLILFILFSCFQSKAQTSWNLVWSDEFNGSTIDASNWNHEVNGNGGGNNELQYYTARPENSNTQNGNLYIIAKKETYSGKSYTSARMTTQGKRSFTYGKIEARIKLPLGKGLWPAFWMLGESISTAGWPACGEIDIMEHVNTENKTYGTIHWDNNGHAQYGGNTTADFSIYHVYSIEWNDSTIKWFLDGAQFWSANILNNINSTNEFHSPQFILLNMAVGGTWPGNPDGTTPFPDTLFVDYVRVYQLSTAAAPLTISVSANQNSICSGASATLTASGAGAGTYTWSPSAGLSATTGTSVTASPTVTTTYTVTGSNNASTGSATKVVTVLNKDDATFSYSSTSYCATNNDTPVKTTSGGTFSISPTGNLSINASTGYIDITTNTTAQHYDITYTTNGTCPNSSIVGIDITTAPDPSFSYIDSVYCMNTISNPTVIQTAGATSGIFSAGAGLAFMNSSTGEINLSSSVPGTYTVTNTIAAGGGCSATSDVFIITLVGIPTVTVSSTTVCLGNTGIIYASGADAYTWSNGFPSDDSLTFAPGNTTTYTVTGTTNDCASKAEGSIFVTPLPNVTVSNAVVCPGGSATITASGATNYVWQDNSTLSTFTDSPSVNNTYTVTGTTNDCSSSAVGNIDLSTNLIITTADASICSGSSATLTSSGATSYSWSTLPAQTGNSITVSPNATTSYTVSGTTSGCAGYAVAKVTVTPTPTVTVNSITVCAGNQGVLTASGASNYVWEDNSTLSTYTATPTITNTYTVTGSMDGCTGSAVADINIIPTPTITVNSTTVCLGTSGTLTASGAATYSWNNGSTSSTFTNNPSTTSTYTVTGSTAGCLASSDATGTIHVTSTDTSICPGGTVNINSDLSSINFSLSQNYPNPFSTATNILFTIPVKCFVILKIFDPIGKEVATIITEQLSAGTYSQQWNAVGLGSGVYFYRLQAGEYRETKKLFLYK